MRGKVTFLAFLITWSAAVSLEATAKNSELEELIALALHQNPEVQASRATTEAARARIPQASALEDPRFEFRATNMPLNDLGFDSTPMSGKDYSLRQKIPFPGKLGVKKKAARAKAAAIASLSQETQNRIRYQVTAAYFQLYRLDRAIATIYQNKALVKNIAQVAEARFATGMAPGPDVFRAQTFDSVLQNQKLALQQEQESARAWLNTLLNREPTTPVHLKYRFSLSSLPPKPPEPTALAERPLLRAFQKETEAAEQRVRSARRDFLPDFDLGVSYRQRNRIAGDPVRGSDFFSAGVTVNVPLWAYWRQNRHLQERKAERLATRHHYEAVRNQTHFESKDLYGRLKRQRQQLRLYQSRLLPQVRATYQSSQTAYEAEQTDFFSTLEALKGQFEMELAYYELKSAYETDRARLQWVLGQNFSRTKLEGQP